LMSAKAEETTVTPSPKRHQNSEIKTAHSDSNQKQVLRKSLSLNREELSTDIDTKTHSETRRRFARKKAITNKADCIDNDQVDKEERIQHSVENKKAFKVRTSSLSEHYNRFTKKKTAPETCVEPKFVNETEISREDRDINVIQDQLPVQVQQQNRKTTTANSHQLRCERFSIKKVGSVQDKGTKIDANNHGERTSDDKPRTFLETLEKQEEKKPYTLHPACHLITASELHDKLEQTNLPEKKESSAAGVQHKGLGDDKVVEENKELLPDEKKNKENQKSPAAENSEVESDSQKVGSILSIRARRNFFETQCSKVERKRCIEKEDSIVQNNSRKSSLSISNTIHSSFRDETSIPQSGDSGITPLAVDALGVAEEHEPSYDNNDSDSSSRLPEVQMRADSTCIGNLHTSSPSFSNSRPSTFSQRAGSTSTYTRSSAPLFRRGFSARASRSLTVDGQGKKKPDLRCF